MIPYSFAGRGNGEDQHIFNSEFIWFVIMKKTNVRKKKC